MCARKTRAQISLGLRSRPIRIGNRKNVRICTDCSDYEIITYTFGPSCGKTFLRSFRPDYCNYQPAQPQRLARILKFRLSANDEDEDQTTQTDLCCCFTQPQRQFLARLLKKLYFYCYYITDRNSFANKLVPNQSSLDEHSDQGLFVCINFFSIFFNGKIPYYKKFSGHFLVAFLDTSNVAHFSCHFSRHLKCGAFFLSLLLTLKM